MTAKILLQLDSDPHASAFDSVVAVDAGVDHLFRYGGVEAMQVTDLVHGAIFTRGGDDLKGTAIFVGGGDVERAEALFAAARNAFFGPMRVSVMLDANGCNTTAAAAVVAASRHCELKSANAVVLGGTGPVGRRAALLLAAEGADVTVTSRSMERAEQACREIESPDSSGALQAAATATPDQVARLIAEADVVIGCGAAGIELADSGAMAAAGRLKVAIDLNAVPPAGLAGIGVTDKAVAMSSQGSANPAAVGYGAIGVGGLKMRTHKAAIAELFTANDRVLDAAEIYAIAKAIG